MLKKGQRHVLFSFCVCILITGLFSSPSISKDIPSAGSNFPEIQFAVPVLEKDRDYLGIGTDESFSTRDIGSQLVLIEIIGVYCPQCHIQHPLFNKLFFRIKKKSKLFKNIKMFAVAVGANHIEVNHLKKNYRISYPVINDPKFEIHKILGEPRTPFTMIVSKDGKVMFAHLGIVKDIDKFLTRITELIQ
jgi:hypothetical protein